MTSLLSQGAYGCVFYPGINCEEKNIHLKIMLQNCNEKAIVRKMRRILGKK